MHKYQKKSLQKGLIALVVVVALAGSFFGGIEYQKHHGKATTQTGTNGSGPASRNFNGQMPVVGAVKTITGNTITVQTQQGNAKKVTVDSTTRLTKNRAPAQLSDIHTGDQIVALGKQNNDGSLAATRVSINPNLGTGANSSGSPAPQQ